MNIHTLFNTFYYYYAEISKEDDPYFEALYVTVFSLTMLLHNSIYLILIQFCKEIHTGWTFLFFAILYYYLKHKLILYPNLIKRVKEGKTNKSEFNKVGTIIFFIFLVIYIFITPLIWGYFKSRCIIQI